MLLAGGLLALTLRSNLWAAEGKGSAEDRKALDGWIAKHRNWESRLYGREEAARYRVVITQFTESAQPGIPMGGEESSQASMVMADGRYGGRHTNSMGSGGGSSGNPLPPENLKRLDELLAHLPEGAPKLPPSSRRLLLEAVVADQPIARVYDRANAPEALWEIVDAMHSSFRPYVPEVAANEVLPVGAVDINTGYTAVAPDGALIVGGGNRPLQMWELTTREMLRELPTKHNRGIVFSPDQRQAILWDYGDSYVADTQTWDLQRIPFGNRVQYSRDGRCVLRDNPKGTLEAFEAGTWKKTDLPPEIPSQAVRYLPAPQGSPAVVELLDGSLALWDTAQHRPIAQLKERGVLVDAAFSPDRSMVVMTYMSARPSRTVRADLHIGLWGVAQGVLIHELKPYQMEVREHLPESGGLLWTKDGHYVLVQNGLSSIFQASGISVFNAKTGRHLGQLPCGEWPNGFVVSRDGHQLIMRCRDGKVRRWDFEEAMRKVYAFEDDLDEAEAAGK